MFWSQIRSRVLLFVLNTIESMAALIVFHLTLPCWIHHFSYWPFSWATLGHNSELGWGGTTLKLLVPLARVQLSSLLRREGRFRDFTGDWIGPMSFLLDRSIPTWAVNTSGCKHCQKPLDADATTWIRYSSSQFHQLSHIKIFKNVGAVAQSQT